MIKVNGYVLPVQPSAWGWVKTGEAYIDGAGRPRYPAVRDFELKWDTLDTASVQDLYRLWYETSTGTCSVDLPARHAVMTTGGLNEVYFQTYSGCSLEEPEFGSYFTTEGQTGVKLVIRNVRPTIQPIVF